MRGHTLASPQFLPFALWKGGVSSRCRARPHPHDELQNIVTMIRCSGVYNGVGVVKGRLLRSYTAPAELCYSSLCVSR